MDKSGGKRPLKKTVKHISNNIKMDSIEKPQVPIG
jgi:hypothetical protein